MPIARAGLCQALPPEGDTKTTLKKERYTHHIKKKNHLLIWIESTTAVPKAALHYDPFYLEEKTRTRNSFKASYLLPTLGLKFTFWGLEKKWLYGDVEDSFPILINGPIFLW